MPSSPSSLSNHSVNLRTPVLIVGGGPVGLLTSVLLAQQGVRSLLVERRSGPSPHPRARGISVRTMEILRSVGLEEKVLAAGEDLSHLRYVLWVDSLTGSEQRRVDLWAKGLSTETSHSPSRMIACGQDALERILLERARSDAESELFFETELVSLEQSEEGVRAQVRNKNGDEKSISANFVVAADGARGGIRESLGIESQGPGALASNLNVYFRADLSPWFVDRPTLLCWVSNADVFGLLMPLEGGRALLHAWVQAGPDGKIDANESRCIALIRKAVGKDDLPVEILSALPWAAGSRIANHYRAGNVFLAGDAAHEIPPSGAFGMNLGLADAHNLAWKLAAVLKGGASPKLLDSYEEERLPVALFTNDQAMLGLASTGPSGDGREPEGAANSHVVAMGYEYASSAIVSDGTPQVPMELKELGSRSRPGCRAPHFWLKRDESVISSIDLFAGSFVLLTGARATSLRNRVRDSASALGVPLRLHSVVSKLGKEGDELVDVDQAFGSLYGIEDDGAVLVRPDGYVAWRKPRGAGSDDEWVSALHTILGSSGSERRR